MLIKTVKRKAPESIIKVKTIPTVIPFAICIEE
jgi:hypothetical protein